MREYYALSACCGVLSLIILKGIKDMKKGEVYEGFVESMSFPGKGYVTVEDRKAMVKGVIEGQQVRVRMKRVRKENCQATLLEVMTPSALEDVKPECPHFGSCGGCSYQTMSYDNQLRMKNGMVVDLLQPFLEREGVTMEEPLASPLAFGYRNKMEFSFGDEVKDGPLVLGMHKKNSTYDIVNTDECKLVHPDVTKVLEAAVEHFRNTGNTFYKKMRHIGCLRHLVVRRSFATGELLVNLVVTTQEKIDTDAFVKRLCGLRLDGSIGGILLTKNDGVADVVKSDETLLLYGKDYLTEELLGLTFRISPFSFFQTNSLGAEVLYRKVRDYVGETRDKVIYDLYSGTGTIAQMLAPVAKKVIGVELVSEAVEAARMNAKLNGLTNCEFIAGDVLTVLDDIDEQPDMIVLDPPRDGLHPMALKKIMDYQVPELVYISCKPTSLARDLELFSNGGYHLVQAGCVDMFPQGGNVETMVKLSLKKI